MIAWISRKDTGKAYGSMVVYVTKVREAMQLLRDQYISTLRGSRHTPGLTSHETDQTNVTDAKKMDIKHSSAQSHKSVLNVSK